jgi:filamentous hemagglutinin family protein
VQRGIGIWTGGGEAGIVFRFSIVVWRSRGAAPWGTASSFGGRRARVAVSCRQPRSEYYRRWYTQPQTLAGPNYSITANLGKQVGANLFHSFGIFGLNKGESANFSGPANVGNVIGRVTGGTASSIDGAINSSIGGANVYLINPAGMVFGPNATVNVSGAFHASTANYLRTSDGARFQATNPSGSTLSAAPPAAFGFLTASPPALTVNGSQLGPVRGTLGMVGGPVTISNGATLSAPAGKIHVTGVASAGEVPVDPANTAAMTVSRLAPVSIAGGVKLDVSDPVLLASGGSVFVNAGALTMDASEINADNHGTGNGGTVSLFGESQIAMTGASSVRAVARFAGAGAAISLATGSGGSTIANNSIVQTASLASGAAVGANRVAEPN